MEESERQPPGLSEVTQLQVGLEFLASRLIGVLMHPPLEIIKWLTREPWVCCQW